MDKYHIFNEIGAGRSSQVFKGRMKKTVRYVAIKRVEKAQMDKVVNEVQTMHALSHPHTLEFYDWYRGSSGDLARWSSFCHVLQEDGSSSPTLQKSARTVLVRPRDGSNTGTRRGTTSG